MKCTPLFAALLAMSSCRGTEPPPEVLPRILKGDCVSVAMQTREGDEDGVLVIDNLRARTTGGAGCGMISQLQIGGWMDSNRNGRVDPGEALRSTNHFAQGEGTNELTLTGLELRLPQGDVKDLKLELSVFFTSGRTTHIQVDSRD